MTSQHDKPKRWRPRFSVRTLVIVVTLVCCYFGCWDATKRWGVAALAFEYELDDTVFYTGGPGNMFQTSASAPLIIRQDELSFYEPSTSRYYFWFFGYVAKLPIERHFNSEWEVAPVDIDFEIDDNVTPLSTQH